MPYIPTVGDKVIFIDARTQTEIMGDVKLVDIPERIATIIFKRKVITGPFESIVPTGIRLYFEAIKKATPTQDIIDPTNPISE
jgi:hypothetical protein